MISIAHVAFSIIGLVVGLFVLLKPKGTRLHRSVGKIYCVSMIGLNFSAFGVYNLTGHFNFFHFTAILSLTMVLMGWSQILFRHRLRNWLYRHYVYMCWSYVALIAAALNEGFVRLGPLKALVRSSGNWVIIVTQLVLISLAALIINRRKATLLIQFSNAQAQQSPLN